MSIDYLSYHLKELKKTMLKKNYRDSFSHYYVPKVEIKDFNVLTDGKGFFDLPIKNDKEAYKKIIEMINNNDYTTGNLLDFAYNKKELRINCN